MEFTQQAGSEEEFGVVLVLMGQHACVWRWLGTQSALSPESCTKKTASKM